MATSSARWAVCLHESAHVVIARALNQWNCQCQAEVYAVGGVATMPHGLTRHAHVVATAAGGYGERLARLHPAPRRRPAPPATMAPHIAALREKATDSAQAAYLGTLTSDADELAAYCVRFCPADPKDWERRFKRIHAGARLAVWIHRVEIVQIALQLFHEGRVSFPGCPEHNRFFAGDAVVAGE